MKRASRLFYCVPKHFRDSGAFLKVNVQSICGFHHLWSIIKEWEKCLDSREEAKPDTALICSPQAPFIKNWQKFQTRSSKKTPLKTVVRSSPRPQTHNREESFVKRSRDAESGFWACSAYRCRVSKREISWRIWNLTWFETSSSLSASDTHKKHTWEMWILVCLLSHWSEAHPSSSAWDQTRDERIQRQIEMLI